MASHDFDAARKERLRAFEGITFTLGGRTFHCRAAFPLIDMYREAPPAPEDLAEQATSDLAKVFLNLARTLADFIVPDDRAAWWEMFRDGDEIVQGDDLIAVHEWLTEEYTGRPTSPSAASSNGRRAKGGSSTSSRRGAKGSGTS